MTSFQFSRDAQKKLEKLERSLQERILQKLASLKKENDERSIRVLHDALPATHRLRIGEYRLILARGEKDTFLVLDVGHRSDIYR
jgi:mRNA-degrading endonuclease RelE of RelBE toxin-antitoxin system